jgi:hypothetical protein
MCELRLVLHVLNELSDPVVGAPVGQLRQVVHLNTNHTIRVAKSSHNGGPEFAQNIQGRILDSVTQVTESSIIFNHLKLLNSTTWSSYEEK